jgi:hypothetical protein
MTATYEPNTPLTDAEARTIARFEAAEAAALQRVRALADRHEATATRRRKLAEKFHEAGRWQLSDGFRQLARQAQTEAARIRAALDGTR